MTNARTEELVKYDREHILHAQIPLYHGKVPADGGLNDDVRAGAGEVARLASSRSDT